MYLDRDLLYVALLSLIAILNPAMSQRAAQQLNNDLFKDYDPFSRPVRNSTHVTDICVGLYILQIVDLSEKNQVIEVNIQLLYIWYDNFLKWNVSEYDNINQLYLKSSRIWTPDLIIMNSAEEKQLQRSQSDKYMLIVSSTGKIRWHYQTLSKSLCDIDPFGFPFDDQTCSIKIRSWSRDKSMLNIRRRNTKAKVKENIKTEWFIINSSVSETSYFVNESDRTLEFVVLDFKLQLRRVTTHYFVKIIFPFTVIAFMTLFTFWLAPDSGEKLTLDVTVLLSLVFYLQIMSEYIPRGYSRIPLLTLYAMGNFVLVLISCVCTVFVLRLYYRPPSYQSSRRNQVPYLIRVIVFKCLAPVCFKSGIHFRKKHETYDNTDTSEAQSGKVVKPQKTSIRKEVLICRLDRILEKSRTKNSDLVLDENEKMNEYENFGRNLLHNLKLLNRSLIMSKPCQTKHSKEGAYLVLDQNQAANKTNMYMEEWKQVALVLDRVFFFVFLVIQPLTACIFLRVNVFEYITSQGEHVQIPNINC